MAIDYSLYVSDQVDPDRLLQIIETELGLDHERAPGPPPEHSPTLVARSAPGFDLTALGPSPRSAETTAEWLGFTPRVYASFRMDKECDFQAAYLRVLRVTSAVLARLPGDLALVNNGEHVLIIRKSGRVTVVDDPLVLDAEELAQIRVPYEVGSVPGVH